MRIRVPSLFPYSSPVSIRRSRNHSLISYALTSEPAKRPPCVVARAWPRVFAMLEGWWGGDRCRLLRRARSAPDGGPPRRVSEVLEGAVKRRDEADGRAGTRRLRMRIAVLPDVFGPVPAVVVVVVDSVSRRIASDVVRARTGRRAIRLLGVRLVVVRVGKVAVLRVHSLVQTAYLCNDSTTNQCRWQNYPRKPNRIDIVQLLSLFPFFPLDDSYRTEGCAKCHVPKVHIFSLRVTRKKKKKRKKNV